jgi:hypothetical protein
MTRSKANKQIRDLKDNLLESYARVIQNKLSKEDYQILSKDVKNRIAEIRQELKEKK